MARIRRPVALVRDPVTHLTPEWKRAESAPMRFGVDVGHRVAGGEMVTSTLSVFVNTLYWVLEVTTNSFVAKPFPAPTEFSRIEIVPALILDKTQLPPFVSRFVSVNLSTWPSWPLCGARITSWSYVPPEVIMLSARLPPPIARRRGVEAVGDMLWPSEALPINSSVWVSMIDNSSDVHCDLSSVRCPTSSQVAENPVAVAFPPTIRTDVSPDGSALPDMTVPRAIFSIVISPTGVVPRSIRNVLSASE